MSTKKGKIIMEQADIIVTAQQKMTAQKWTEALSLWKQVLPVSSPLHTFQYITCLLRTGFTAEAEEALISAIEDYPESHDLLQLYAQRLQNRGEHERALRYFSFLRRQFSSQEDNWHNEIKALFSLKRFKEADALLAAAATLFPASMETLRLQAEQATRERAWTEALKRWRLFRERFSKSPIGWRRAIDVCIASGNLQEADKIAATMHPDAEAVCGSCFIRRKPGSPHVIFIFSAYDIPLGNWPGGNGLFHPNEFQANIVILNDVRKTWFMDGIFGFGDMRQTADKLRELKNSLLGRDGICLCYGNSMGGYGACLYGSLIGADICLAPGLQGLAPNPIGTLKSYKGIRKRLETYISQAKQTFFHILVGESCPGDYFGCLRLRQFDNVYIQSVKNFSHGVTGYLTIRKNIRTVIKYYLHLLQLRSSSKKRATLPDIVYGDIIRASLSRESQTIDLRSSLICRHAPYDCVDSADKGNLLDYPYVATYIYSTFIMLSRNLPAHQYKKRISRLLTLIDSLPLKDIYIAGYIYEAVARAYHKCQDLEKCLEYGKLSISCNGDNPHICDFLCTICSTAKKISDSFIYASKAISLRDSDMMQGWYGTNRCYDIQIDNLTLLGHPELALELAEKWLARPGFPVQARNAINEARKRSLNKLIQQGKTNNSFLTFLKGQESWRWWILSRLWEWAGDKEAAITALTAATERKPGNLNWGLHLIDLLRTVGRDEEACAVAAKYVQRSPWGAGFRRLSQIYERAKEFADKAMQTDRVKPYALEQLAAIENAQGNRQEAKRLLEKALHLLPGNTAFSRSLDQLQGKTVPEQKAPASPPINKMLERTALEMALDITSDDLASRLRLANNLKSQTFRGALAVLQPCLEKYPSWEEGHALARQLEEDSARWLELHNKEKA